MNVLYKYFLLTPETNIDLKSLPQIKCGDSEFTFSQQSIDILDNYVIEYFKEVLDIYQKNLEEFLSDHSPKLA